MQPLPIEPPPPPELTLVAPTRRFALVGNPCVGKTQLFERLTSAAPGEDRSRGVLTIGPGAAPARLARRCRSCASRCASCAAAQRHTGELPLTHLLDTPGALGLAATGEDEIAVSSLLLEGELDGVLLIADAKNMRRSLAVALQVAELGLPMVLNINMIDEADSVEIDDRELARALGVPTHRTIAPEGTGVRTLAELIFDARVPNRRVRLPARVEDAAVRLTALLDNDRLAPRALALLLLMDDRGARAWVDRHLGAATAQQSAAIAAAAQRGVATPLSTLITDCFLAEADRITARAVLERPHGSGPLQRFGDLAQQPLTGAIIAVAVLGAAYLWIGELAATRVVDALQIHLFHDILLPLCDRLAAVIPSPLVRDAIMDRNFGLLPAGVFLALGLVLPVLFAFYLFQAVLEDSGYLPRLAVLLDRALRWLGLNGRGLIPLVLSFSCVTMAVLSTRSLPSRKQRLILTLLVVGLPCAPLLAVLAVVLAALPLSASAAVFGVIGLRLVLLGLVLDKLLPGEQTDLIMEIPRMRIPRARVLLSKTWRRTWQFMREAVPVFLVAALVVFLFDRFGGLAAIEELARPVVHGLLGLPDQAVQIFIKTVIRRESGAAELRLEMASFDNLQIVVTLLLMTFVMPCVNALFVIVKERGLASAAAILGFVMVLALATGVAVNGICHGLGIAFG